MPIVSFQSGLIDEGYNAVRLARYAQIVGWSECAFFGVNSPNEEGDPCRPIQTLDQRRMIARYLTEAQDEIEQVCNFPLYPRWIENEQHPYKMIVRTKYSKILDVGVRAVSVIASGASVDHTSDPAVVGPVATTVTDVAEVRVCHPGTDIEIDPSSIAISGGVMTISIPRCRMVTNAECDNPESGLDYTDTSPTGPFERNVDVKRVYNDTSTQGILVWPHRSSATCLCLCTCGCANCSEFTETACEYIQNKEYGLIDVMLASQSGGVWKAICPRCFCNAPSLVRLNYRAGLDPLTEQATDAVIRLAHSKMPSPPCGCGPLNELWTRDRHIPDALDRERLNCPFGLSDGAWVAWQFANALRVARIGNL